MNKINGTAKAVMKEGALSKANSSAEKKIEMMVNENYGKLVLTTNKSEKYERKRAFILPTVIWLYSIGIMMGNNMNNDTCMSTARFPGRYFNEM